MTLYRHEMKMNLKSLIIWTLCVGGMCFGCILLYTSLEDSLQEIADVYANMGAMSTALGMDKMSLATLTGFYATEIAMMHGLGGAMFAADMMCRIIPAIENVKYLTPFYYSNGADIFTNGEIDGGMLAIGIGMLCAAFVAAFLKYGKKDLAA